MGGGGGEGSGRDLLRTSNTDSNATGTFELASSRRTAGDILRTSPKPSAASTFWNDPPTSIFSQQQHLMARMSDDLSSPHNPGSSKHEGIKRNLF
jgi:hypothetical protein